MYSLNETIGCCTAAALMFLNTAGEGRLMTRRENFLDCSRGFFFQLFA
jgi:hypothetical protein